MQVDTKVANVSKKGEELCGDNVEVVSNDESTIIVLSDGLGSGVKANILSNLTTKIASKLLENGISIDEAVETITKTLPVCKERQLAYSTLSVLQIFNDGRCYLVEIDNPPSFFINKEGQISQVEMSERQVEDKKVREANFKLDKGDMVMLVSDGVVHAGIEGLLNFGLGWSGISDYLAQYIAKYGTNPELAQKIVDLCEAYYCMEPGDDTTAVIAQFREEKAVTLFTGPPKSESEDSEAVQKLVAQGDKKVVCGGTTAQIVARELNEELEVKLEYYDEDVPPTSEIEGIDLVTEGLLTLNKTLEKLEEAEEVDDLPDNKDGATKLAKLLLNSDDVNLLVGQAINSAHQSLKLPEEMSIRNQIIKKLVTKLNNKGKEINLEWF